MNKLKVGILTYHSEMNYGCTLQAYAMQEAYKEMGQDPIIIDRYITPNNALLLGPLNSITPISTLRLIFRCILDLGTASMIIRVLKTLNFHRKYMHKTTYSFYEWDDAPKDLGVDMISVGSDQIWNANLYSPIPYLLKDINPDIPGISYAASIGMPALMPKYLEDYKVGFSRFKAISVREQQAVRLIGDLGYEAAHVVDPTLLVSSDLWNKFRTKKHYKRKRLLCYTLAEDLFRLLPVLEDFARRNDCDVILFPDRYEKKYNRNIYGLKQMISERYRLSSSPVNVFVSAAIEDFMREISAATWIVTNSYHALMFSVIYKRNIRIIVPTDNIRKGMHARMQEFADSIIGGPLMQSDMLEALASFERGETITFNEEELTKRIQYSRDWLKRQIRDIADGKNR
jgi:hypothetical protein